MVHKVKLNKGQILTKSNLIDMCNSARATYDYVKIEMYSGLYIFVTFGRNNMMEVSTNSRDLLLYNQMQTLRRTRSIAIIADYLFNWINRYNK
jgi:hypothetical protein